MAGIGGQLSSTDDVTRASKRRRTTWLFLAAAALNGLVYLLTLTPWMVGTSW